MKKARRASAEQGFTLVEMMLVVAIIGILASLTLPGVENVMHTTKLTETMAEMRTVAHAWDAMSGALKQDDYIFTGQTINVLADFPHLVTAQELENLLEIVVPEFDSWGNRIEYRVDALPSSSLLVRSANSDGEFDDIYVAGTEFSYGNRRIDIGITTTARWIIRPDAQLRGNQVNVPVQELDILEFVQFREGLPPPGFPPP